MKRYRHKWAKCAEMCENGHNLLPPLGVHSGSQTFP
uniref:Uncharacterized protein n=1 Tax=Parascaris equorum TaxID=6256 RepID=A0A914RX46_PAREQ